MFCFQAVGRKSKGLNSKQQPQRPAKQKPDLIWTLLFQREAKKTTRAAKRGAAKNARDRKWAGASPKSGHPRDLGQKQGGGGGKMDPPGGPRGPHARAAFFPGLGKAFFIWLRGHWAGRSPVAGRANGWLLAAWRRAKKQAQPFFSGRPFVGRANDLLLS